MDITTRQTLAEAAAIRAGDELFRRWTLPAQGLKQKDGHANDYVSEADETAERIIVESLTVPGEECRWWGEEGGQSGRGGWRWVVDPLDGTFEYLQGLPNWCVSIGGEDIDDPQVGVVYSPTERMLVSAVAGGPVTVNGRVAEPTWRDTLDTSLIAISNAHTSRWLLDAIWGHVGVIRSPGSMALALAHLAQGHYDLIHYYGAFHWYDAAAGVVLAESAGCEVIVRGLESRETSELIAGPPALVEQYRRLLPSDE